MSPSIEHGAAPTLSLLNVRPVPTINRPGQHQWLALLCALSLASCAGVKVNTIKNDDYLALRRGDVLTTRDLRASSKATLQVVGIDDGDCCENLPRCRARLKDNDGLAEEGRLSALAELWLLQAMGGGLVSREPDQVNASLEIARHAYAYLFFTSRSTSQRALEDRQTQVRDYYKFAVQEALTQLFALYRHSLPADDGIDGGFRRSLAGWDLVGSLQDLHLTGNQALPRQLIPIASLSFAGLRNQ
jgi:hypothetical protein